MQKVIFENRGPLGLITLNRPEALNALDLDMVEAMLVQLATWQNDLTVTAIAICGTGKAFCAGGDIRAAWQTPDKASAFFTEEYRLVQTIHAFPKPVIALIDGIVMGGGAGISINARHCIVTERALFAMPETAIGFYPDVGATWFLPRLPGEIGTYLALTGTRLKATDLIHTGLATQFVASDQIEAMLTRLVEGNIDMVLGQHASAAGEGILPALKPAIDRCFAFDRMEDILQALEAESSEWAATTAITLSRMAPTSLKVTLRQMRVGRSLEQFADAIALELTLTRHLISRPDFVEGVRAALIDRDNAPRWQPPTLDAVDEAMIERLFEVSRPESLA